jgi:hypothetical protein
MAKAGCIPDRVRGDVREIDASAEFIENPSTLVSISMRLSRSKVSAC